MEAYLYHPLPGFPPISVTEGVCHLNCSHCSGHYLKGMRSALTGEELKKVALKIARSGGYGFLLSGGSSLSGEVMFKREHVEAVRWVKRNTSLIVNLHPGLMRSELAEEFASAGVDVVSLDVVGSEEAIREVFHLNRKPEDYLSSYHMWVDLGVEVVPHITVGLRCGAHSQEENAIEMLKDTPPRALVVLGFIPTPGTPYSGCKPPPEDRIIQIIKYSKETLGGGCDVLLGCMRPREYKELEWRAIEAGARGVAAPRPDLMETLTRKGWKVFNVGGCCALHALKRSI